MTENTPEAQATPTAPSDPNQVTLKVTDPFWVQAFHFIREGEETIDITPAGSPVPADLTDAIIADAKTHDVTIVKVDDQPQAPVEGDPAQA